MRAYGILIAIVLVLTTASAEAAQKPGPTATSSNRGGAAAPGAIVLPKYATSGVDRNISGLESDIRQYQIELGSLNEKMRVAKARISAGLQAPDEGQPSLADLEAQAAKITERTRQLTLLLAGAERVKILASPVDIKLKASPIRQATEALSRASRLSISVDPKVPQSIKVSAEARNVPLGAIVEVMANGAGLIIAPTDDGGLLLRLSSKLIVDGKSYVTEGGPAPWSNDWCMDLDSGARAVGRKWQGLFAGYTWYASDFPMSPNKPN